MDATAGLRRMRLQIEGVDIVIGRKHQSFEMARNPKNKKEANEPTDANAAGFQVEPPFEELSISRRRLYKSVYKDPDGFLLLYCITIHKRSCTA